MTAPADHGRPVLQLVHYERGRLNAVYALVCKSEHIAELELAVPHNSPSFFASHIPTTKQLRKWDLELETHINDCWDIARHDPKTTIELLGRTLDQVPGYENAPKPRIGETVWPRTGARLDTPIPWIVLERCW